jgi:hypothetical protein
VAAEGGRVGRTTAQCGVYRLQHAVKIPINIVVPEAKDSKTFPSESGITICISGLMFIEIVLSNINLDDKPVLHAHKVDNKSFARRLPSEMEPSLSP